MTTLRTGLLLSVLLLGLSLPAQAQTYATRTLLDGAITAGATVMIVDSNTGFTVGQYAYIDNEAVRIVAINGTSITISRGQLGTPARAHADNEPVITGANNHFQQVDPDYGAVCTPGEAQAAYLPWINVLGARIWSCNANVWQATTTMDLTINSIPASIP